MSCQDTVSRFENGFTASVAPAALVEPTDGKDRPMTVTVSSGVTSSGLTISSGNALDVDSGGTAESFAILSGGSAYDSGFVSGTLLNGGEMIVWGHASGTRVSNGGVEDVEDGRDYGTVVGAGGFESVKAGYENSFGASSDTVQSGGVLGVRGAAFDETVLSGGAALIFGNVSALILSGGKADVESAGQANGATILAGGVVNISGNLAPTLEFSTISSGGEARAWANGATDEVTIMGGGALLISQGGFSYSDTLSGGKLDVYAGGQASGTTILDHGMAYVFGAADGTMVSSGGADYVLASGTITGTMVSAGGEEVVSSGGVASATTVSSGGYEIIRGGAASATVVSGGRDWVSSGGAAMDATVAAGGVLYLLSSGTISGTVVSNGGVMIVSSGGVADGVSLLAGAELTDDGQMVVSGSGTLAGVLLGSGEVAETAGGTLLLSDDGAKFAGQAVISGGTVELTARFALGTGSVAFVEPSTGSAVLRIDAPDAPAAGGTFANVISNFNGAREDIDLPDLAYVTGATAVAVGSTLELSDGGKTYDFHLAGDLAGAYPVLNDGSGGVLIDPKAAALIQAAASFAPTDAGSALLNSGASSSQTLFAHAAGSASARHG